MNEVKINEIVIGTGKPKICVPIIGSTFDDIESNARAAESSIAELVEWRCDYFSEVLDETAVNDVLRMLKKTVGNKVILCTCRTANEGGEIQITEDEYIKMYSNIIESGLVNIIDVELLMGASAAQQLIAASHKNNVKVIMSNHDFSKTPDNDVIIERITKMENLGSDIAKMAAMPQNESDVIRLMSTTRILKDRINIPIVTMSMGKLGVISRMAGEVFGSDITFASVTSASAPGQINIDKLSNIMDTIHTGM